MKCCATCGQTLPEQLPLGLQLRGKQAHIVAMLHKAGSYGVPIPLLFDRLYELDPNGGPDTGIKVLHVQVNHLNRELRRFGYVIRANHRGGHEPSSYVLKKLEA